MNPIYCISGLGADQRIFSKLTLPGRTLTPMQWILPQKEERIEAYAARMISPIYPNRSLRLSGDSLQIPEDTLRIPEGPLRIPENPAQPHPVFLGVSFGGMMALEMAKLCPGAKVILISSVKSRKELPGWMKVAGGLGLNKLLPRNPPRWHRLEGDFLGTETQEERQLVREFSMTADPLYLRWAIGRILNWRNQWQPPACYHIHGTHDRTFPLKNILATHIVPGGGHFMVMNRAKEVSTIIESILAS